MLNYEDLLPLTKDLPSIAGVNNLIAAPFERIVSSLISCGADVTLFNLTEKVRQHADFNSHIKRVIPKEKGKDFLNKFKVIQNLFAKKHPHLTQDYEYFFCGENLHVPLHLEKEFQACEVVLLGEFSMLIDADMISEILRSKKTVAWSSSANLFTGFCGQPAGCEKWQSSGCADCPMLGRTIGNQDMCATFFARKLTGFADIRDFVVVTPSRWLSRESQRSVLGKPFFHTIIPTCVKLDTYMPIPQSRARKDLGIPIDSSVILLASTNGMRKNKGTYVACEALSQLQRRWGKSMVPQILFFGHKAPYLERLRECGYEVQSLGWIDDIRTMAKIYAAADVFVSPSFQDNLPNTVNEALACGTPVICFDRFSSEDVVIDGVTGFLAKHPGLPLSPEGRLIQPAPYEPTPERCADLAEQLLKFFELPMWRRECMRHECRQFAEATFNPVEEAMRYLQLFRNMLGLHYIQIN